MNYLADYQWDPAPWFAPTAVVLTLLGVALAVRGWNHRGMMLGVVLPWLLGTTVLGLAVAQWHLDDQELLRVFSKYGELPPPWPRFYLYVGALGLIPMLGCFGGLVIRPARAAGTPARR